MQFDTIIHRDFNDTVIDYGIIKGNNTVVLIKAGLDGSMMGYKNKYLTIATKINQKYGYTVIVSSNPATKFNALDDAINLINELLTPEQLKDHKVYYMGFSNGGYMGLVYGHMYPQIKRMLIINTPIMFNWHKAKDGFAKFIGEKVTLVFGECDQSIPYVGLLDLVKNKAKEIIIYPNANHQFVGMLEEFIELPFKHLC